MANPIEIHTYLDIIYMKMLPLLLFVFHVVSSAYSQDCSCPSMTVPQELDNSRFKVQMNNGTVLSDCRSILRMIEQKTGEQDLLLCFHGHENRRFKYTDIKHLIFEGLGPGSVPYRMRVAPARQFEYVGSLHVPKLLYLELGALYGENVVPNYKDESLWFYAGQTRLGSYTADYMYSFYAGIESVNNQYSLWFPVAGGIRRFFSPTTREHLSDYEFHPGNKSPRCSFSQLGDATPHYEPPTGQYVERHPDSQNDHSVAVFRTKINAATHVRWFISLEGGVIFNEKFGLKESVTPELLNPEDRKFPLYIEGGIGFIDGGSWMLKGLVLTLAWRYMQLYHVEGTDCMGCVKTLLVNNPVHGLLLRVGYQF